MSALSLASRPWIEWIVLSTQIWLYMPRILVTKCFSFFKYFFLFLATCAHVLDKGE